MTHLMVGSTK